MCGVNPKALAFPTTTDLVSSGLTKREYFAAAALNGIMANPALYQGFTEGSGYLGLVAMALTAVTLADKLILAIEESAK